MPGRRGLDQSTKARAASNAANEAMARSQAEPKRPALYYIIDAAPMLSSGQVVIELGRRRRRIDAPTADRGVIASWKPSQAAYLEFLKLAAPEDLELLDLLAAASEPAVAAVNHDLDLRARRAAQATKRLIPRGHIQPNMSLSVEFYAGKVGGRSGVKLEEQILITERGPELLAHYPWDEKFLGVS